MLFKIHKYTQKGLQDVKVFKALDILSKKRKHSHMSIDFLLVSGHKCAENLEKLCPQQKNMYKFC